MTKKIVALAGDGIGPEIMEAGLAVLEALASKTGFNYVIDRRPLEVQVLMLRGIPYLMKPSRHVEKQMLFSLRLSVVLSMMEHRFGLNKACWLFVRNSIFMLIFAL